MRAGRVRQFLWALSAHVSMEDRKFVEKMLVPILQNLFFAMSVPDQCHALRTARCAQRLMSKIQKPVDSSFLTRCALLHDIGRKQGDLGTIGKSVAVLFATMFPQYAYSCANNSESILHKKMRIYFHHAEIGADILEALGFAAEADIIRKHHKAPAEDDSPELRLLRMADAQS